MFTFLLLSGKPSLSHSRARSVSGFPSAWEARAETPLSVSVVVVVVFCCDGARTLVARAWPRLFWCVYRSNTRSRVLGRTREGGEVLVRARAAEPRTCCLEGFVRIFFHLHLFCFSWSSRARTFDLKGPRSESSAHPAPPHWF